MTDPASPSSPQEPQEPHDAQDQALHQRLDQAHLLALLPNHRNLYMLAVGLLIGVLLGPAVLGKYAPQVYEAWFVDVPTAVQKLTTYDVDQSQLIQRLAQTQATGVALEEFKATHAPERRPYLDQLQRAYHNQGRFIATIFGVMVLMVLEALPDPKSTRLRGHLATARYALMSLALALLLAQPQWLQGISISYLVLIGLVALGLALVPLSRPASR